MIDTWLDDRAISVGKKERKYGVAWSMSFTKAADWATQAGISASGVSVAAEVHLFSRPTTALQFKRTCERPKMEGPRLCYLDRALKFNADGTIVEGSGKKAPTRCRIYHFSDFPLLDYRETEDDKSAASDAMQTFLSAKWHGAQAPTTPK